MLLLSRFTISGHSMEPTIKNGDSVFVSSVPFFFSKPKVGDIVLIRHSGERSDSRISSQSSQQRRRFWTSQNDEGSKFLIKRITKIDPSDDGDRYFVKGDNKRDSVDSRRLGRIGRREIVGKVVYKIRVPKSEIRNNTLSRTGVLY